MKNSKKYIQLAATSFLLSITLLLANTVFAADIQIETYVEGGLTIALNGDWDTGIIFTPLTRAYGYEQNEVSSWDSIDNTDFIDIVDDTATTGFYVTMTIEDFTYIGADQYQTSLDASNLIIFGEYASGTPTAATIGYDDPTKTYSILPNSCAGATVEKFSFHSSFSSSPDYSLTGSNSPTTIIDSTADCLVVSHLRFDHLEIFISQNEAFGIYSGNIKFTAIDGTP